MDRFVRVTEEPLLGLDAVPWARPRRVVKGGDISRTQEETRRTIIHPSVLDLSAVDRPAGVAARFIMYYAPHHSHGIGAAAADDLRGPWTPLAGNPVLTLDRFTGIENHISGPDVVHVPGEGRFRMYAHGSVSGAGQQTVLAVSDDGVYFEALSQEPVLAHPYLRVFRREGVWYGVARFGKDLGLVRSPDGIEWEEWPHGLFLATGDEHEEYDRLRHHAVRLVGDVLHVYYCTYVRPDLSVEAIKSATMDVRGGWRAWPRPERRGIVLAPELAWENGNLRDPYLIETEAGLFMFYVGGNESGIALAKAQRAPRD